MDLNRATILGRLTRDPEVRTTTTGRTVATIGIATGRKWKDQAGAQQEATEFHNCVLWGRLAEIAGQYLTKGRQVYMEGRLQTRDWTGQDGVKRYRTEIVVDNLIMLDGRGGSGRAGVVTSPNVKSGQAPEAGDSIPTIEITPLPGEEERATGKDEEIKVEDLPF